MLVYDRWDSPPPRIVPAAGPQSQLPNQPDQNKGTLELETNRSSQPNNRRG